MTQFSQEPYRVYFAPEWDNFIVLDVYKAKELGWPDGLLEQPPQEAITRLELEAVRAIIKAAEKTDLLDAVLAKRVYSKDMANRHLDVIEQLIGVIKNG